MRAKAFAKINLGLHVGPPDSSGLHRIRGLFQSIGWSDSLHMSKADEDAVSGPGGAAAIDGWSNLAWRATELVRRQAGSSARLAVELTKRIPVAAGLGGGSADAAAALGLAGRILGVPRTDLAALAPRLGSDVPFCFSGGLAAVSGTGDVVTPLPPAAGYAVALVVPPAEVSTAAVYRAWDTLEAARGPEVGGRDLPPSLREHGPFANDLYAAAVACAPSIDEWRAELAARWHRSVLLTGSGPTLFSFFVDEGEARAALDGIPRGARAAEAAVPVARGWEISAHSGDEGDSA